MNTEIAPAIRDLLRNNHTLQRLELYQTVWSSIGCASFAIGLKANRGLRCLDISRNAFCNLSVVSALTEACIENGTLRELILDESDLDVKALVRLLKKKQNLESLSLRANFANGTYRITSAEGFESFAEALAHRKGLQVLDVGGHILEGYFLSIAGFLKVNRHLRNLSLERCDLLYEDVVSLAEALTSNMGLKVLNLNATFFRSEWLSPLMEALKVNKTLEVLRLDYHPNWATPLAAMLRSNNCLQNMEIDVHTDVVDEENLLMQEADAIAFTDVMNKNTSLEKFTIICRLRVAPDSQEAGDRYAHAIERHADLQSCRLSAEVDGFDILQN